MNNPMQSQQMLQQPGMMMDGMQPQQQPQQYGPPSVSYGASADNSPQLQQRMRPMATMQQMHSQNPMMQGVQSQQAHPMQMQQQAGQQQMQMPGQPMVAGRPMMMAGPLQSQLRGNINQNDPKFTAILNRLPIEQRNMILQQPAQNQPALIRQVLQQMQQQRMQAANRPPQQWPGGGDSSSMISQQFPGAQPSYGAGPMQSTTSQPAYQQQPHQQRHPMTPMTPGQQQVSQMPPSQQIIYRDTMQSAVNQPMYAGSPISRPMQNVPPPPSMMSSQSVMQPSHQLGQQQSQMVGYGHAAGPSPGGYNLSAGGVYPTPSPVPNISSGPSPGYAADASPGYGSLPINAQKMAGAEPSPLQPGADQSASAVTADDIMYKEKVRELQVYMDQLKRTLEQQQQREGNNPGSQNKVQKFIDILEGRSKVPYDVLLKCEASLKSQRPVKSAESDSKASVCQPFLDAVVFTAANKPNANAILKRTFELPWSSSLAAKRICPPSTETTTDSPSAQNKNDVVPLPIQREVAALEAKFSIKLDKTKASSSSTTDEKTIHIVCDIEDSSLPLVPPLKIGIPLDYMDSPTSNPKCNMEFDDYTGTPFFDDIKKRLNNKFSKLPKSYTLTTLLNSWDICVRQACFSVSSEA